MDINKKLAQFLESGREFVLATVIEATGSSPARSGFKMIVSNEEFLGTVGGGTLEYKTVEAARETLKRKKNSLIAFDLKNIGMTCGGQAKIFFEYIQGEKRMYIFGGGHICQAFSPIAASLGFKITVLDNRSDVANKEKQPFAHEIVCEEFESGIDKMKFGDNSFALIATNKHAYDGAVIKKLCEQEEKFRYIAMIGSKTKVKTCLEELIDMGIKIETLKKIYSPAGLKIGGDSPAEIAVAIAAEVIAFEHGKDVPNMKTNLVGET